MSYIYINTCNNKKKKEDFWDQIEQTIFTTITCHAYKVNYIQLE